MIDQEEAEKRVLELYNTAQAISEESEGRVKASMTMSETFEEVRVRVLMLGVAEDTPEPKWLRGKHLDLPERFAALDTLEEKRELIATLTDELMHSLFFIGHENGFHLTGGWRRENFGEEGGPGGLRLNVSFYMGDLERDPTPEERDAEYQEYKAGFDEYWERTTELEHAAKSCETWERHLAAADEDIETFKAFEESADPALLRILWRFDVSTETLVRSRAGTQDALNRARIEYALLAAGGDDNTTEAGHGD